MSNDLKNEFDIYMHKHYKLACSQDIFVWYCLRLGIIDFDISGGAFIAISKAAKTGRKHFVANRLISLLNKGVKQYEDKADDYLTKCFGFEIATCIRRYYLFNIHELYLLCNNVVVIIQHSFLQTR